MEEKCERVLKELDDYCRDRKYYYMGSSSFHEGKLKSYKDGLLRGIDFLQERNSQIYSDCKAIQSEIITTIDYIRRKIILDEFMESCDKTQDPRLYLKGISELFGYMLPIFEVMRFRFNKSRPKIRQWLLDLSIKATSKPQKANLDLRKDNNSDGREYQANYVKQEDGKVSITVFTFIYGPKTPLLWGEFIFQYGYFSEGDIRKLFFFDY